MKYKPVSGLRLHIHSLVRLLLFVPVTCGSEYCYILDLNILLFAKGTLRD